MLLLLLHVEAPEQEEREYQWCSLEIICWSWIMRQHDGQQSRVALETVLKDK
jgi:hypothetical protein